MSLEIQDDFAATYAKYGHNKDNWMVLPQSIGHVLDDWLNAWLREPEQENLGTRYTQYPQSEKIIREVFGKFFTSLKERNHVHVPEDIQQSAIQEYLED